MSEKIENLLGEDRTFASASLILSARASAEKPPNTTECTAPILAHASIEITISGVIPR